MEIKAVGVVGCGIMGTGIAQVCAQSGYQVVISEINNELLTKGLSAIDKTLSKAVEKGKLSPPDKDAITGRIKGTTSIGDFASCELVVEAVVEDIGIKKKVFTDLDGVCPPDTILATNTSCLPITEIAAITSSPDKVLGLHFFNPVPVMVLLEIVRALATSDETLETSKAFGKSLGKTIITAQDRPGFVVNRLLVPFILDAIRMLESGVATREDVDTGVHLGLNHPMGPLTLADFTGLDTCLFIAEAMYAELKDPAVAPPTLLKRMVAAGWFGRKAGKGFYDYREA